MRGNQTATANGGGGASDVWSEARAIPRLASTSFLKDATVSASSALRLRICSSRVAQSFDAKISTCGIDVIAWVTAVSAWSAASASDPLTNA